MSNLETIEQLIEKLSPAGLATFRRWYASFDAEAWDRQFETDVKTGKLDALADEALRAHTSGQPKLLRPIHLLTRPLPRRVSTRRFPKPDFWSCYYALPASILEQAHKAFELLKEANPQHPSLHFKEVDRFWSER